MAQTVRVRRRPRDRRDDGRTPLLPVSARSVLVGLVLLVATSVACTSEAPGTPRPEPTVEDTPPAADGSDRNSCQDGICEIRVNGPGAIPLDPRFGVANLRVESITQAFTSIAAELTRAGSARTECRH